MGLKAHPKQEGSTTTLWPERYRKLLHPLMQDLNLGVVLIDTDMHILAMNPQMQYWFPHIDITGRPLCYQAFRGKSRHMVCDACPASQTLLDGKVHHAIMTFRVGQQTRHYRILSLPVNNNNQSITAVLKILEDVSEEQRAEARHIRDRERYHTIFSHSTNGVAVYRPVNGGEKFVCIEINKAGEVIEGLKASDALGQSLPTIFPKAKQLGLLDAMENVLDTEQSVYLPVVDYHEGQIALWRDYYLHKLMTGDIVAIFSDETENERLKQELRGSEDRYRVLTEHVADGVVVIQNERIVFANSAFATMLGHRYPKSVLATKPAELIDAMDLTRFQKTCQAVTDRKTGENRVEVRLQTVEKGKTWTEFHLSVINWEGKGGLLGTVRSIDESKHREQAIKAEAEFLRGENTRLKSSLRERYRFRNIIGKSRAMQKIYDRILQAADSDSNVVIYGESGTGKELVARAIHELSDRRNHNWVTVNCGAIPENLLESEFFGYKKGAFSGAAFDKIGLLDCADKGTLFLDEIGELPLSMQVKLLRAIEGGGFIPIGGNTLRKPSLRVIAATNRDLKSEVQQGLMREDFFYRIHVIPIHLPPLKERKEDIPLLVAYFLETQHGKAPMSSLPSQVMDAMVQYDWPGNIRELQNFIHRYMTLNKVDFIELTTPSPPKTKDTDPIIPDPSQAPVEFRLAVEKFEKQLIQKALVCSNGNKSTAAKLLKLQRKSLYRKIRAYGLE